MESLGSASVQTGESDGFRRIVGGEWATTGVELPCQKVNCGFREFRSATSYMKKITPKLEAS